MDHKVKETLKGLQGRSLMAPFDFTVEELDALFCLGDDIIDFEILATSSKKCVSPFNSLSYPTVSSTNPYIVTSAIEGNSTNCSAFGSPLLIKHIRIP